LPGELLLLGPVLGQLPKMLLRPPHEGEELGPRLGVGDSVGVAGAEVFGFDGADAVAEAEALGVGLPETIMLVVFGVGNAVSPANFEPVPCISFMKSDQIASG
jgi:hypothetical protein